MGDGGLDNEDVVDQVKLLPQGDLQHVHLHNERGEEDAKTKNGRGLEKWLDLKSKKHHENDLLSCFKEASIEHRRARAVWSAEHKRVFVRNGDLPTHMRVPIIGDWIMFSLVTASRLSKISAKVVHIPSDGLVSFISYLGRGGLTQCWLCGT